MLCQKQSLFNHDNNLDGGDDNDDDDDDDDDDDTTMVIKITGPSLPTHLV